VKSLDRPSKEPSLYLNLRKEEGSSICIRNYIIKFEYSAGNRENFLFPSFS